MEAIQHKYTSRVRLLIIPTWIMTSLKQERKADMVLLMITDVLREGTELLFIGDGEIIKQALDLRDIGKDHVFIPGLVSRKKQLVPALTALWG